MKNSKKVVACLIALVLSPNDFLHPSFSPTPNTFSFEGKYYSPQAPGAINNLPSVQLADVDFDGTTDAVAVLNGDGVKKVFSFGKENCASLDSVNSAIPYSYDLKRGKITFASPPAANVTVHLTCPQPDKTDIAIWSLSEDTLKVFRNMGNGNFSPLPVAIQMAMGASIVPTKIEFGDLNRDGRPDLVLTGPNGIYLLRNSAPGIFGQMPSGDLAGVQAQTSKLADLDSDGWLDLIVVFADTANPGYILQYYRNINGVFTKWFTNDSPTPFNPSGTELDVADFNLDGRLDVIYGWRAFKYYETKGPYAYATRPNSNRIRRINLEDYSTVDFTDAGETLSFSASGYSGIAVDETSLYVTDTNNNAIKCFDKKTLALTATYTTVGTLNLDKPISVTVLGSKIYIGDEAKQIIVANKSDFSFLRSYGTPGRVYDISTADGASIYFTYEGGVGYIAPDETVYTTNAGLVSPSAIVVSPASGLVFIGEKTGKLHRVDNSFFTSGASTLQTIGSWGSGQGEFRGVTGLTLVNYRGYERLHAVDYMNFRYQVFNTSDLSFVSEQPSGASMGDFIYAIDADERMPEFKMVDTWTAVSPAAPGYAMADVQAGWFNNDELPDFIGAVPSGSPFGHRVFLSTGTGFTLSYEESDVDSTFAGGPIAIRDLDSDGVDDIVIPHPETSSGATLITLRNNNANPLNFNPDWNSSLDPDPSTYNGYLAHGVVAGFLNSDAIYDLAACSLSGSPVTGIAYYQGGGAPMVKKIRVTSIYHNGDFRKKVTVTYGVKATGVIDKVLSVTEKTDRPSCAAPCFE